MTSTELQRRKRRRRALSWIPISIVALICVAVVVGAIVMQNSWWTDPSADASDDQQTAAGFSMLGGPGVDYLTRQGIARIKIADDAPTATELGIETSSTTRIEPRVPIKMVVVGEGGTFYVDLARAFTVTTSGEDVVTVSIERESNGAWSEARDELSRVAEQWGWTQESLDQLPADLAAASHQGEDATYSASLPPMTRFGVHATADLLVDTASGSVTTTYVLNRAAD